MRPIDADKLLEDILKGIEDAPLYIKATVEQYICEAPVIDLSGSNAPLTLDELREMAWSQSPVWCSDTDGVHAGLLCIQDEWCTSERTPHIWLLDEEGHSGVYSIESLLKCGARFYRRKPEEGTTWIRL